MFKLKATKSVWVAILVTLLINLACGSSTPQVNVPSVDATQPVIAPLSTPTEEPKPLGSARSNPAPVGSEVTIDDMVIKITEFKSPTNDIVQAGNQFNTMPEAGNIYVFVNVSINCNKGTDATCNIGGYEFSVIDTAGITHDSEIFLAGVSGLFEPGEFYGGATKSGYLAFVVPEGDNGLILKYSSFLASEAYFSLQ